MKDESARDRGQSNLERAIGVLVVGAAIVGALWVLATFVIADESMLLQYPKVLAWPLVAASLAFGFRGQIRDKVRDLRHVSRVGVEADFSGHGLEVGIASDVDQLIGVPPASEVAERAEADPAEARPPCDQESDTAGSRATQTRPTAEEPIEGSDSLGDLSKAVLSLAESLALAPSTKLRVKEFVEAGESRRALATLDVAARELRQERNVALHQGVGLRREAVEEVVRKSAEWGYRVGASGAGPLEPDIEWNSDGTWHIVTQVPKRERRETQVDVSSLEEEIRQLGRRLVGEPFAAATLSREVRYLKILKRRLRKIAPQSPWAVEN